MNQKRRIEIDPAFDLEVPKGWTAEPDEEGGITVSTAEGPGLLHLIAFPQAADEIPDPGEELYAFLEEQGIELEEDEVEDVELEGGGDLSLCEYIAEAEEAAGEEGEEEEGEGATFWLVGVATAPGILVFCSYTCPAGEEEEEREAVRAILASLRLHEPA